MWARENNAPTAAGPSALSPVNVLLNASWLQADSSTHGKLVGVDDTVHSWLVLFVLFCFLLQLLLEQ